MPFMSRKYINGFTKTIKTLMERFLITRMILLNHMIIIAKCLKMACILLSENVCLITKTNTLKFIV